MDKDINKIKIRGARVHNLRSINLDIPKNKLVVFTGVSGSGKSSLAYDTIYAEGQRRYVESLSTYARQFLGIMEKPDVDYIEGLSPAISIDQKTTSRNPRSTVGTTTEIYDYLRLMFSKIGHPHCPVCTREISSQSLDEIVNSTMEMVVDTLNSKIHARFIILSPIVRDKKGEFSSLFDNLKAKGYKKVRLDNYVKDLSDDFVILKTNKHSIDVEIDKFSLSKKDLKSKIFAYNLKSRLTDSIEQALKLSDGLVIVSEILDKVLQIPEYPKNFSDHLYSERFACPVDNIQIPEIEPRTFSFNSPHGACSGCSGLGMILKAEKDLIFAPDISITEGGILPFKNIFDHDTWYSRLILAVCRENGIDPRIPIKNLEDSKIEIVLNGTSDRVYRVEGNNRHGHYTHIVREYRGIIQEIERRHCETESDWIRIGLEKHMRETVCSTCNGDRLKPEALSITIDKESISQVTAKTINDISLWIENLKRDDGPLTLREKDIAHLIINEVERRIKFLMSVGLDYITLSRPAGTLAGGEAQRIRLASQIGSGLTGVLYVLDEPTIGLHIRDNGRLISTLKKLRDLGNTIIVVEHDENTIKNSDFVVDFGPGAGREGGKIIAYGTPDEIAKNKKSITGAYISGRKKVELRFLSDKYNEANQNVLGPGKKKEDIGSLTIIGCQQYNLKNIDVEFPLNKLVCVTGVSGSGKSTLLVETLYHVLKQSVNPFYKIIPGKFKRIEGEEKIKRVVLIDQSPIGRTPRSNPATYTKVFDLIRDVFANTRESRAAGYKPGRFSFNVKGGRCEACDGQGKIKIEMQFMSDLWVICEICKGKRYNNQTLEIAYKGLSVADVLAMTVTEAKDFFHLHPKIIKKIETLENVGLGYIELGQSATTLSGGEAQRVKLASELSKTSNNHTLYIHFSDVEKLMNVLKLLVFKGNSVFIIEHNLDVIRNCDWVIDLGPEGGKEGGEIVAQGKVEDIKKIEKSYTGKFLKLKGN